VVFDLSRRSAQPLHSYETLVIYSPAARSTAAAAIIQRAIQPHQRHAATTLRPLRSVRSPVPPDSIIAHLLVAHVVNNIYMLRAMLASCCCRSSARHGQLGPAEININTGA